VIGSDNQSDRLAAFDNPRNAKPGGERKGAHRGRRHVREIESDDAEIASLEDEGGGLQRTRGVPRVANPEKARQIQARGACRNRIESITGIDQRYQLATRAGRPEGLAQHGRTP
jgi:hypothetical protein